MALELTLQDRLPLATRTGTPWSAVVCLSLLSFLLVGLEFMPVSLLTPIARDLNVLEGQAGQAIAVSGFFAVITSLFGASVLARLRPQDGRPALYGGAGRFQPGRRPRSQLLHLPAGPRAGRHRDRRLLVAIGGHPGAPGATRRPATCDFRPSGRHRARRRDRRAGRQLPWGTDRLARHFPYHRSDRPCRPGVAGRRSPENASTCDRLRVRRFPIAAQPYLRARYGRDRPCLHGPKCAVHLYPALSRKRHPP